MAVVVTTPEEIDNYDSGEKWHIDDHDTLHVVGNGGGNIAAYARGAWLAARVANGSES